MRASYHSGAARRRVMSSSDSDPEGALARTAAVSLVHQRAAAFSRHKDGYAAAGDHPSPMRRVSAAVGGRAGAGAGAGVAALRPEANGRADGGGVSISASVPRRMSVLVVRLRGACDGSCCCKRWSGDCAGAEGARIV